MFRAGDRTIGRAVDSPIGENLIRIGKATNQKDHIQSRRGVRFLDAMKKSDGQIPRKHHVTDHTATAMEQMELYCAAHSGSPSAARRPRLLFRGELWIALLGPSMEEGIAGIGPTVEAALRAFDAQYLAGLRSQSEAVG